MRVLVSRDDVYAEIRKELSELDSNRILGHLKKADAIEIPKEATNGDVMKLAFPNYRDSILAFFEDTTWWYTPYERGEKK